MASRVECPICGEKGWIQFDEPGDAPCCPQCGHALKVHAGATEGLVDERPTIDDAIVSWLNQSPIAPPPESVAVVSCISCGFEGLMPFDSARGDTICPACLAVYRMRPEPVQQLIDCPNCQEQIALHQTDRGKTIVCPACNYFLGCVLLPEKRRFNALPFLNTLLGTGKG